MLLQLLRKVFLSTATLVLVISSIAQAQNSTISTTQSPPPKDSSITGVYTGREIVVPVTPEQKEPEPEARSFVDGFLRNTRQHVGLSFGASELYARTSQGKPGLLITTLLPQLFVNFDKKKFNFRLTYNAAYRRDNRESSDLSTLTQSGTASFGYTVTRRKATLQLSNNLTSAYHDAASLLAMELQSPYQTDLTSRIYVDRRRQTRYTSGNQLNYSFTKRTSITGGLTYDLENYSGADIRRSSILSSSIGASYEINKWLYINTRYTHYLNNVDQGLRGNNIQDLQFGGLSFKLGRGWGFSSGGGINSTKAGGIRWVAGSGQASVSKTSGRTKVEFSYSRGYSSVFPSSQVWHGDTANIYVVQSLSRQVIIYARASYFRGAALVSSSVADTVYGGAGLEIALQKNFAVSASYYLTSQRVVNVSVPGTNVNRYSAAVGLTYYLPSFRSEARQARIR
jgi:hypothetical protein